MSVDQTAGGTEPDLQHAEGEEPVAPSRAAQVAVALGVLALGLVVLWQASVIPGEGLDPRGPRLFPLLVGLIWTGLAIIFVGQTIASLARGGALPRSEALRHTPRVLLLVVLVVVYALGLEPVGYLLTTVVLFPLACLILGSRQHVRDVLVGLGMALVLYYSFTELLGIHLPSGVLP